MQNVTEERHFIVNLVARNALQSPVRHLLLITTRYRLIVFGNDH